MAFNHLKTQTAKALISTALALLGSLALAGQNTSVSGPHTGEKIRVLNDQGLPIVGADVTIGGDPSKPFANLALKTDASGSFTITDAWQTPQPVTIAATGYIQATFLDVAPEAHDFQIHAVDAANQIEIKGTTTNFPEFKKDGKVQFGLVYPAVTRRQLSEFDINAVLSPQFDEIKVLTESVQIPSNLTLPEQTQTYILPIKLDKPDYRVYVRTPGTYRVTATHGQFPLKQVVSALKDGKQFYEVLDMFTFAEYGQRDVVVNEQIEGQDIPVSQVQVSGTLNVQGPALADNQVMLSAAMVKQTSQQGDRYFLSDLKRVNSGDTVALGVPSSESTYDVVSLLMPTQEAAKIGGVHADPTPAGATPADLLVQTPTRAYTLLFDNIANVFGTALPIDQASSAANSGPGGLSVALNASTVSTPSFLGLVARPAVSGQTISLTAPAAVTGLTPVATYVVLSEIDKQDMGKYKLEHRIRMWELYSMGWTNQIQLPNLPLNTQPGKNYRWEVYFMATTETSNANNSYFLDTVTHVTHNSFDL